MRLFLKIFFGIEFAFIALTAVFVYMVSKENALLVIAFYSLISILLAIGLLSEERKEEGDDQEDEQ